ncbi:MAG: hypothetical protein KQI35_14530 [Bacteroidetes bacterium]|nr:hypothetical protein [Bacteroidota bacterium]
MNRLIRLLIIIILILLMLVVGILTFGLIWSEFIVEADFETSGTGFNKTIIWMFLIFSTLLSTLIENINSLIKHSKTSTSKGKYYDISDFEFVYTIKMDFWRVFKISFCNTFREPIFFLFTGIFVLPLFQDKEFIDPFNFTNILIMIMAIGLGMIILSFLHSVFNYILTYGSGKELNLTISQLGLFFKDKKGTRHLAWSKIKKIQESDLFIIFKVNRFYRLYILKDLIDKTDLGKIRKNLT